MHHALLALGWLLHVGQLQLPQPVGFVNDFARVVAPDAAARMTRVIQDVRAKSRGEIVVVTLPDLRGRDAADVAREIARQWRVGATGGAGDRGRNAGVIILLVPRATSSDGRGHSRIEVGSGAEGFLTDATVGAIQDEALTMMQAGDYSTALELETVRVAQRFAREFGFTLESGGSAPAPPASQPRRGRSSGRIPPFLWILLIIVILRIMRGRRRRRGCGGTYIPIPIGMFTSRGGGWSSGGFRGGGGGGFGGFGGFGGGGGFSGGGAGRSF